MKDITSSLAKALPGSLSPDFPTKHPNFRTSEPYVVDAGLGPGTEAGGGAPGGVGREGRSGAAGVDGGVEG